jgi:aspartyl-tRNA(Asn)/glutamyl-tRNA(Gln) amidotransferase subunit A
LCGIVGFKPSRLRVPTEGAFPLSFSLDSVGPLARTVADCAAADAVMANEEPVALAPVSLAGLRLGVLQTLVLGGIDETVGRRYPAAIGQLARAGARLSEHELAPIDAMLEVNARGGLAPAEAYAIHRDRLARRAEDIDPNVRVRIIRGVEMSAPDYVDTVRQRGELVRAMDALLADFDAFLWPTTPIVAPTMAEMADPKTFAIKNGLLLRNTAIVNFFDLCAISLPMPGDGLPCGLMLVGRNGSDKRLLRIAAAVEQLLGGSTPSP